MNRLQHELDPGLALLLFLLLRCSGWEWLCGLRCPVETCDAAS